jgi:hypothetical protein
MAAGPLHRRASFCRFSQSIWRSLSLRGTWQCYRTSVGLHYLVRLSKAACNIAERSSAHENGNTTSLGVSHRFRFQTIGILKFGPIVHIPTFDALVHIVTGLVFLAGAWINKGQYWPNKSLAGYFLYYLWGDWYELGSHHCRYCFYTNWLIALTNQCG